MRFSDELCCVLCSKWVAVVGAAGQKNQVPLTKRLHWYLLVSMENRQQSNEQTCHLQAVNSSSSSKTIIILHYSNFLPNFLASDIQKKMCEVSSCSHCFLMRLNWCCYHVCAMGTACWVTLPEQFVKGKKDSTGACNVCWKTAFCV